METMEDRIIRQLERIADALEGIRTNQLQEANTRKKYVRGRWTPEEDLIILENWNKATPQTIADILYEKGYSRSADSIHSRYFRVLRRYQNDAEGRKYLRFTKKEKETIRNLRENEKLSYAQIAKRMVELGFPKRWTSSYIQICNNFTNN